MDRNTWFCIMFSVMGLSACQSPVAGPPAISMDELAGTDRLNTNESLAPGQSISAGSTTLVYQGDNNLVLYQNGSPLWASSGALGSPPSRFVMQGDCNAVVYSANGPSWASNTAGQGSACFAQVIEGDWFICSGTNRVFSARGGGSCGSAPSFQCHEPNGSVPLPGIENYHVRIDPDSLYVCDTLLGWEGHFPWPQPSQTEVNEQCVGACGAGCSSNTCTHTGIGNYVNMGNGQACRDTQYDCYSTDCCYYHDLCGRMFPTAVFTDPFCHALAIVYGCVACIGSGFPGCSVGPSYTRSFVHPYTDREDCVCADRPGDCYDDCSGQCWPGCDVNFDCYDDCTGQWVCGDPFCPDFCNGLCGGFGWCVLGEFGASRDSPRVVSTDLQVRVGDQTMTWRADELTASALPLASVATLAASEQDGLGARPGWSLRELVRRKLGDAARVTALVSRDGKRVRLDAAAWSDTDGTPILRVNHNGQLRFHWVGGKGRRTGLKDVQTIEVVVPDSGPGGHPGK